MATEFRRMAQRRGSAAAWTANNEVPLSGEFALQVGPGTGEVRAKIGDGLTPFSDLPWIFEVDAVARAAINTLTLQVASLDTRVDALETATGSGGSLDALTAQVSANTAAIAQRQMILPVGINPGDMLYWDGTAYATTALSPAPGQATILFWDVPTQAYRGTTGGAVGQALIVQPGGRPGWGNPSSITVTVTNETIPLAGSASVEDAFNAAAPTIAPDAVVTITWEGFTYHYIGAPGVAITTAIAADFTLLGMTVSGGVEEAPIDGNLYARFDGTWAAVTDFGIAEAPMNGVLYGRQDGTWQPVDVAGTPLDIVAVAGATLTPSITQAGAYFDCTNAAGCAITIPPNASAAFPIGTTLTFEQAGGAAAPLTFIAGAGVTIRVAATNLRSTDSDAAVAQIIKKGTNLWTLFGNLEVA